MSIVNALNQTIKVNLIPNYTPMPIVYLSQYDNGLGRPIRFEVYDGDQEYVEQQGITIRLEGTRPDGFTFSYGTSHSNNVVIVSDYTNEMTYLDGNVRAQLVFTNSSEARVGTIPIVMHIERAGINADTILDT